MADTTFVNGTVVQPEWLNDVNDFVYHNYINVTAAPYNAVGNGIVDDTAALAAAIAAGDCFIPNGTFKVSSPIPVPTTRRIIGQSGNNTKLVGSHAGVIFDVADDAQDCYFKELYFDGTGCTGIYHDTTGGSFPGYLIQPTIEDCHFTAQLAYGINADLIFARIKRCSFGYDTSTTRPGTMVGLRSFSVGSNFTNLNRLENCIFHTGVLSPTTFAMDISGGSTWQFDSCDFEQCGRALRLNNVGCATFNSCWFEANTGTTYNLDIGAANGAVEFVNCNFTNVTNTPISYSSTSTTSLVVRNSAFGLAAGQFVFTDSAGTYGNNRPANGCIFWDNNYVSGGDATNRFVTSFSKGATGKPIAWYVLDTSGTGTLRAQSHPAISVGTRTGTGDININLPFLTATTTFPAIIGTGRAGVVAATIVGTSQFIRHRCYAVGTSTPTDDTISVMIFGN